MYLSMYLVCIYVSLYAKMPLFAIFSAYFEYFTTLSIVFLNIILRMIFFFHT